MLQLMDNAGLRPVFDSTTKRLLRGNDPEAYDAGARRFGLYESRDELHDDWMIWILGKLARVEAPPELNLTGPSTPAPPVPSAPEGGKLLRWLRDLFKG